MLLHSKLLSLQVQKEGKEQLLVLLPDLHQILKIYPSQKYHVGPDVSFITIDDNKSNRYYLCVYITAKII